MLTKKSSVFVVPVKPASALPRAWLRLTVNRTNSPIYASVISGDGSKVPGKCLHGRSRRASRSAARASGNAAGSPVDRQAHR